MWPIEQVNRQFRHFRILAIDVNPPSRKINIHDVSPTHFCCKRSFSPWLQGCAKG